MKKILVLAFVSAISLTSCTHKVLKPIPPGQVKKQTAPGQVKKTTGSQSAAPYAPGQQKKASTAKPGKGNGKKN